MLLSATNLIAAIKTHHISLETTYGLPLIRVFRFPPLLTEGIPPCCTIHCEIVARIAVLHFPTKMFHFEQLLLALNTQVVEHK